MLSIFASRHLMAWACESMRLLCSLIWASSLCADFGPFAGVQTCKILGFYGMHVEHALTMQHLNQSSYWGMFQLHL